MSDTPANTDGLTTMVTQSKTSHWCEFTKTWPYKEICITCGEEAPVLYDSDTCSSGDADETGEFDLLKIEEADIDFCEGQEKSDHLVHAHSANLKNLHFLNPSTFNKSSKEEKVVYAAVKSTPFIVKASKEEKVVKSKSPKKATKKATKKAVEINYPQLFKDYPLFLPTTDDFNKN